MSENIGMDSCIEEILKVEINRYVFSFNLKIYIIFKNNASENIIIDFCILLNQKCYINLHVRRILKVLFFFKS